MKKKLTLLAAAFVLVAWAAPAAAQDLTGTWAVEAQGRRGPQTMTFELVQDGSSLTGKVTMTMGGRRGGGGGGGAGAQTLEIEEGSVEGSDFSLRYTLSFNGNSIPFNISGSVDGDEMSGTIDGGRGGGRPFTGTRGG